VRLLADENTHIAVVYRLKEAGFDVEWIGHSMPGISDRDILARPDIGLLILITKDRDFGDLIFNRRLPCPRSVLYTRLPHRAADLTASRLIALLEAGVPAGQMITLTKNGDRAKPFPAGAQHG
jgi:predicted nuclease of predicted toxin-antitoxin system